MSCLKALSLLQLIRSSSVGIVMCNIINMQKSTMNSQKQHLNKVYINNMVLHPKKFRSCVRNIHSVRYPDQV